MTRYTNADFGDDDSINSVQLTEGTSYFLLQLIWFYMFFDTAQVLVPVPHIFGTIQVPNYGKSGPLWKESSCF